VMNASVGLGAAGRPAVVLGLGRIVALYGRAHPLYTRHTNTFGASIPEATMRPNPRWSSAT
jgi:hypothetical protein